MEVVETEGVLGGKPRIEGTRVSVLQIAELVVEADEEPATVAEELGLDLADVHRALAFYYDNPERMEQLAERKADLIEKLGEETMAPDSLEP